MKFFNYDISTLELSLNVPEILLVKEFAALIDKKRGKSKENTKGTQKERAFREFTYIYLMYDWQSIYSEYSIEERNAAALSDSGLSTKDLEDTDFINAVRKYIEIQDSSRDIRLIHAAQNKVDDIIKYFNEGSDLFERTEDNKPIFKAKEVINEMTQVSKVLDELERLETRVKKKQQAESGLRAGATEGFLPRGI